MAQTWDCGSGFRCRTTAQTQDPTLIQDHSSDTEPQIQDPTLGPRLQQGTAAPHSGAELRLSHRTLTPDLGTGSQLRHRSHVGPCLRHRTPAPSSDVGPQLRHGTPGPGLDAGSQLRHRTSSLCLDTGQCLGPHLPAQPQTKPLNPTHPAALPRSCTGTVSVWRGLSSNPCTHCGAGCSPHKGFRGAGRARGAVTACRSGSVAGARCRCRILWVIKSPPAPRGEIAALGDSDKAAGEIPSEMQKRCAGRRCR